MKKVLTLLAIMAIAMGMVFADGTGSVSGEATGSDQLDFSNKTATLDVTLDLTDGKLGKYFEIGFASEAIGAIGENNAVPTAKVLTSLELTETTSGGDVQNAADTAFIYWIIKGNPKLKISLSADGAMTGETDTNKINWKVSWDTNKSIGTDKNYSTNTSASYSGVQVHADEKTIDVGYKPLTIITQDISEAAADSYSGKLTLTIEPTEST